jgi:hypothetical protein
MPVDRGVPLEPIHVVEARVVGSTEGRAGLAAEVVIEHARAEGAPVRRALTVRPRQQPVVEIGDGNQRRSVELESFDLFATASVVEPAGPGRQTRADVSAAIARLAGVARLGRRLPSVPATIEVDDYVTIELRARYAPYRNGSAQGEERSLLSETLTKAMTTPPEVTCDVRVIDAGGSVRRVAATSDHTAPPGLESSGVTITPASTGHRLVIGPLGQSPASAQVDASLADRFGLRAWASAWVDNYRIVEPLPWVEQVAEISLDELRRRHERIDATSRRAPTDDAVAAAGMIRCLAGVMGSLDGSTSVPASRVAGVIRLASRVAELVPSVGRPDSNAG